LAGWPGNKKASDSVNIDVSVTTDAAACIPTLSNNGIVDFGKRSAASLSGTHFTQWGSRDITLNIVCEASTAVAITARDSRPDSLAYGPDGNGNTGPEVPFQGQGYISNPDRLFGLGKTTEGKNIGSYAIVVDQDNVQAQDAGKAVGVSVVGASNTEGPWSLASPAAFSSGMNGYLSFARKNSTTLQPVTTVVVPLRVSATIANGLVSGNNITLDGLATITLTYL
jgi:hypothetical protein